MNSHQIARWTVSLSWIYHGFFPKIFHIAPLERQMTVTLGLNQQNTEHLIRLAGVAEILFGIIFWFLYRNTKVVWLNIFALFGLLMMVVVQTPTLLIEAFNPVTTNLSLIALSTLLLQKNDNTA